MTRASRVSRALLVAVLGLTMLTAQGPQLLSKFRWAVRAVQQGTRVPITQLEVLRGARITEREARIAGETLGRAASRGIPKALATERLLGGLVARSAHSRPVRREDIVNGAIVRREIDTLAADEPADVYAAILAGSPGRSVSQLVQPRISGEVTVLDALPHNAGEYERVFGRPRSAAAQAELEAAQSVLPSAQRFAGGITFAEALDRTTNQIVIVIGHNEGGLLRMPSGHWLELRAAADVCGAYGKLCIFLSCSSNSFVRGSAMGVRRDISVSEAVLRAKEIEGLANTWARRRTTAEEAMEQWRPAVEGQGLPLLDPERAMKELRKLVARQEQSAYMVCGTVGCSSWSRCPCLQLHPASE